MDGGWVPSDSLLLELGLLFGLADFKHDSGIPGRQKNARPRALDLSQKELVSSFRAGKGSRQRRQPRASLLASLKTGATGELRGAA